MRCSQKTNGFIIKLLDKLATLLPAALLVFAPILITSSASANIPRISENAVSSDSSYSADNAENPLFIAESLSNQKSSPDEAVEPSIPILASEEHTGSQKGSYASPIASRVLELVDVYSIQESFPLILHLIDLESIIPPVIEYSDFKISNSELPSFEVNLPALKVNPRVGQLMNPIYATLKDLSDSELDRLYPVEMNNLKLGNLISDYVFEDYTSMSEYDIQLFLEAQGRNCVEGSGGAPCLKDYIGDIPDTPGGEKAICSDIFEEKDASAARILYLIAIACKINPQVLIVHMQKEQGLVESNFPTSYMYRAAMGFNCPDSRGCGKSDFWNQLRKSSEQKIWYGHSDSPFTRFKVGERITLPFHPKAECGSKTFLLDSIATASLYYYTPYVPDSASISAVSGVGGKCSSYGNRNFYRLFNQWFGDSTYTPVEIASTTKPSIVSKRYVKNDSLYLSPANING